MEGTFFSIIPALIMLALVLLTRKVLLSLGVGIVVGVLFIHNFSIVNSMKEIWIVFYEIFVTDGSVNSGNVLLLGFLLLLGMMTAFLAVSGGSKAFGDWMIKRIKTRTGAKLMTAMLGLILLFDDYFNILAVGGVVCRVPERRRISAERI